MGEASSARECLIRVRNFDYEANGVTYQSSDRMIGGAGNCFAEFNSTYIVDENPAYESCILKGFYRFYQFHW